MAREREKDEYFVEHWAAAFVFCTFTLMKEKVNKLFISLSLLEERNQWRIFIFLYFFNRFTKDCLNSFEILDSHANYRNLQENFFEIVLNTFQCSAVIGFNGLCIGIWKFTQFFVHLNNNRLWPIFKFRISFPLILYKKSTGIIIYSIIYLRARIFLQLKINLQIWFISSLMQPPSGIIRWLWWRCTQSVPVTTGMNTNVKCEGKRKKVFSLNEV